MSCRTRALGRAPSQGRGCSVRPARPISWTLALTRPHLPALQALLATSSPHPSPFPSDSIRTKVPISMGPNAWCITDPWFVLISDSPYSTRHAAAHPCLSQAPRCFHSQLSSTSCATLHQLQRSQRS